MNPPADAARRARLAAEEAVRLDDGLSETHTALALVANLQSDPEAAWPALQRAIELNPSNATAYQALSFYWIVKGDFERQLHCIERAMELDPRSANIRLEAGWPHGYERRYDLFLQRAREALELDPDYALAHFNVGVALEALGDPRRALFAYERALTLGGLWGLTKGFMSRAFVKLGDEKAARSVLEEIRERASRESGLGLPLAIAHDALGEAEAAADALQRADTQGEATATSMLHLEGFLPFEATRDHPRFRALSREQALRVGRV
jgi:tetratricopeptide (TPR) repeat protein